MENRSNLNLDGLPMYHMRRIGKPATKDGVVSVMDFYRATYMIGRSAMQVDFYIDSERHVQSASLSRCHARIVRQAGNQHKLYDDSLNGVFVNNIKIAGSCVLREGDKVTFGHPCGARLPAGSKSRQPDSDNQFMFEMCSCDRTDENGAPEKTSKEASGFKKPCLPTESASNKTYHQLKRAARYTTQCFSPGDIRQLKKAWEDRQSGSSTSESSDVEETNDMSNRQTIVKTNKDMIKPVVFVQSDDEQMDTETNSSIEGNGSSAYACARGKEDSVIYSNECKTPARTQVDYKSIGRNLSDSSSLSLNSANIQNNVNENEQIEVDNSSDSDKKCSFDGREDLKSLEGTFNSIMKDLCALRGNVEHDNTSNSQHVPVTPKKSPTKDACIQTSQIETGADPGKKSVQTVFSPTKEMAIQTSQTMFSEQMDSSMEEYTPDVDILSEGSEIPVSELSESVQVESQSSIETDLQYKAVKEDKDSECVKNSELPFSTTTDKVKDHFKQNVTNTTEISAGVNSDTINGSRGAAEISYIEPITEDFNQETTYADKRKSMTSESESLTNGNNVDENEMSCVTCDAASTGTKKEFVEEITSAEEKTLKLANFTQGEEHKIECTLIEQRQNKSIDIEINSKETQKKEISEGILTGYKEKESEKDEMACKYSQDRETSDISEAICADGPSLILSDSVESDEDEDHETPGIELSNSIEFTDSESEDISDSETDDHRQDDLEAEKESTSDFGGQDSEMLESNQINVTRIALEGDLNTDNDDKTSNIESECSIFSDNCIMDDSIDTEMLDAAQTNQSDCTGVAVPVNINVDLDESINYEGSSSRIAVEETCTGEMTTGNKNGLNTCLGLKDCNRKRKLSNEIIDDTVTETQRKRHCSDDMNVTLNDKNMVTESNRPSCNDTVNNVKDDCNDNIGHKETEEEVCNNYDIPLSDEEAKCSSERQSRLNKFKKGVKRFFKFWSKKSYKLKEKSGCDVSYTYIQDKAGNYNLLELQCPYKISVSTEGPKDVPRENSDNQIYTQIWTNGGLDEKTSAECMEQDQRGTNDKGLEEEVRKISIEQDDSGTNEDLDGEAIRICMEQDQSEISYQGLEEKASRICMEQDQSGANDKVLEEKASKVCIEEDQSELNDEALEETSSRECMGQDQSVMNNKDFDEKLRRKYMGQDQSGTNNKGLEEVGSRECTEQVQSEDGDYAFGEKTEELLKGEVVDVSCENIEENKQRLREDVCHISIEGSQVTETLEENDLEVTTVTDDATIKHPKKSIEEIKENSKDLNETIKNSKHLSEDENSSSELENVDSDADRVETSICQTDNEIDPDDMIKTSVLIPAINSDFQSTGSTEQTSLTTLPDTCSKLNVIASQSQSPIIFKQGESNDSRNMIDKVNSVKRLCDKAGSEDDVSSQLSCKFSDDEEDDFLVPEIDFNQLDDSEDVFVEDSESKTNSKQSQQDIFENVASEDENESGNEQESENLEKNTRERNRYQNTKDEEKKNCRMDESGTNIDDNTSDPLENYINHNTEDDSGSEYADAENIRENSARVDLDFDFCDSESDKETLDITKMKKSEKMDIDDEDMDENVKSKQVAKRKIESDIDDRSPKRKRNRAKIAEKLAIISMFEKETNTLHSPFKTPSSEQTRTQMISKPSPDQFSCTQLMDSSQAVDLNCLTATQASKVTEQLEVKARDNSRPKASRNKAKDFLEKLRAKRRIKEERLDDPPPELSQCTSGSAEIMYSRTREQSRALAILEDVDKHVNSCHTVVNKLKSMLDSNTSLKGSPRVNTWKQELAEIEKKFNFPKTVIALVGDTGSGKSCLMNAILDHRSVLPTSGIRACTAVVVEVVNNTTSSNFEADIEFLQRKEWMEELQVLLKDLTGRDGTVKNRQPDPTSDAFISYCKVKAVYGKIDRFEVLSRLTTVTYWLGRVKVVKSTNPEDFRQKVEKYIETQEPGTGGQYWPIVKHVRLRMPNCDVCSSGAALVDLPGVRDSNAARDRIAKEYLKNCTAVWVVSSIHRAIDDKTAKELLGENFRRQLLMDGQYGSIAFICTKTDVITPSEIIRPLDLEGKTKVHEDQICEMESQKSEMETTVSKATAEMGKLRKKVKELKKEARELHDNLGELKSLLDPEDLESSQSEEKEAIQEYEQELKEKEEEQAEAEERMDELHDEKLDSTQKILELEKKLNIHRKAITAICAKARNEYARTEIRRDFKTGLKEMKRRAGMLNDDDEEEDIYVDDNDDDDDVGSSAENLRVFCCSSTEYQKMKNLLTDDGPPQVFSSLDETQIPALRHYVHEMTSIRRKQWLERLIRSVGRLVFDLQMYICEGRDMKSRDRMFAKSTIDSELQKFGATLVPVFYKLSVDIDRVFDGKIRQKMEEGAANATSEANTICAKWSAPLIKDKTKDKRSGGLHAMTYGATVRREGVYSSRSYGHVDFNEDLAEPVYRSMTIVWDRAFSGMLWKILEELKTIILSKLKEFTSDLAPVLEKLGIQHIKTIKVSSVLQNSASNKLTEMVAHLKEIITIKQRDISRIITPHIQSSLLPAYNSCEAESGTGMYARMKSIMSKGIDTKRFTMFDEATQQLMKHLVDLQTEIVQYVGQVSQSLIQDLRTAFEPLWEAPSNTSVMRSVFHQAITEVCASVQEIYEQAGIPQTEERALVPVPSSTASVSSTASLTASHGGSNQTVAGCSKEDDWHKFENTFQRKNDTPYGVVEQWGQIGVRVKTERLSQDSLAETVETVPRVQTLHVKQENQDEQQNLREDDESSVNFGCQTLQDLQYGKLEILPVEIAAQTMPVSSVTASKPSDTVTSCGQSGAVKYITLGENSARGHSGRSKCHLIQVPVKQPPTATTSMSTVSGQHVSQQANMKSLITGKNVKLPVAGTCDPVTKSGPSNLHHSANHFDRDRLVQTSKQQAAAAVEVKSCKVTPGSSLISRPRNTPALKLMMGKENVGANSEAGNKRETISASQPCVNSSSFTKGEKKLGGDANVTLSQKDTVTRITTPPVTIKTEPADRGIYGRVKYLGMIDLTDE